MANPDRPNGFTFVKSLSGAPVTGLIRSVGVSGADIFVGDMLELTSGLAVAAATNGTEFLGVAVGFGKVSDMTGEYGGAFNPDNLTTLYYDDSANTNTEWRCFYVPVGDAIFEAQSNADLDILVGAECDLLATTGSVVTGRSAHEIAADSNSDFRVVEIPAYPDNDFTLTNTRYHIMVKHAEHIWQVA